MNRLGTLVINLLLFEILLHFTFLYGFSMKGSSYTGVGMALVWATLALVETEESSSLSSVRNSVTFSKLPSF
jgi:hypothetical protein